MIGKQVRVIPSRALDELKLSALVGQEGEAVEIAKNGVYVKFIQPFMESNEWFIPKESAQIVSY